MTRDFWLQTGALVQFVAETALQKRIFWFPALAMALEPQHSSFLFEQSPRKLTDSGILPQRLFLELEAVIFLHLNVISKLLLIFLLLIL